MFDPLCRGRAWRGSPKPMRRSWLRKQSAQALLGRLGYRRANRPGSPGGLSCMGRLNALVKLRSGGFGYKNAKIAGPLLPGVPLGLLLPTPLSSSHWPYAPLATAPARGVRRSRPSNRFCHPDCDLCEPAFLPAWLLVAAWLRTRSPPYTGLRTALGARRSDGVRFVCSFPSFPPSRPNARSGSDGRQTKTCSRCSPRAALHGSTHSPNRSAASAHDADPPLRSEGVQNARSTPANTRLPETCWHLAGSSLGPAADVSLSDPDRCQSFAPLVPWLAASRLQSSRFPTRAAPGQSGSTDRPPVCAARFLLPAALP